MLDQVTAKATILSLFARIQSYAYFSWDSGKHTYVCGFIFEHHLGSFFNKITVASSHTSDENVSSKDILTDSTHNVAELCMLTKYHGETMYQQAAVMK